MEHWVFSLSFIDVFRGVIFTMLAVTLVLLTLRKFKSDRVITEVRNHLDVMSDNIALSHQHIGKKLDTISGRLQFLMARTIAEELAAEKVQRGAKIDGVPVMFKSCPMVYHETLPDDGSYMDWPAGHFAYAEDLSHIYLILPTPYESLCIIWLDGSRGWKWDGNREKPTITPSIFHDPKHPESGHHWHGFVTAGEMKGC